MSWEGIGYATKIEGKMDAELYVAIYVAILEDELQKSLEYWCKTAENFIFQQNNDPKHASKLAKA